MRASGASAQVSDSPGIELRDNSCAGPAGDVVKDARALLRAFALGDSIERHMDARGAGAAQPAHDAREVQ